MHLPNITIHLLKFGKHQKKSYYELTKSYVIPTVSHYAHTIIKQMLLCTYQKLLWWIIQGVFLLPPPPPP